MSISDSRQKRADHRSAVDHLAALLTTGSLPAEGLQDDEWSAVVDLALQQDVAPALYGCLKDAGASLPQSVEAPLRQSHRANVARNMRLFHELAVILGAFQQAGVSVVPFKGAQLTRAVYPDIGCRTMADLDLWIQRSEIEHARRIMQSLGYARVARSDRPAALQDALLGETQMVKVGAPLVELHWNIFPGEWVRHTARVDESAVWARATPLDGPLVRELSPEDAVIHLCVHLAVNHQLSGLGLRTLVDLNHARRAWSIDWGIVAQRAARWRVSCATWVVLRALGELLGDPGGALPLRRLAPGPGRRRVIAHMAGARQIAQGMTLSAGPRRFVFLSLIVDRPTDAVRLVWRAVCPDRRWLALRYDEPDAGWLGAWRLRARHIARIARTGNP